MGGYNGKGGKGLNSAEASWGNNTGWGGNPAQEEFSMGGSVEEVAGVHEVRKLASVHAVVEEGVWKVKPNTEDHGRTLGDFMVATGRKRNQEHKKSKKSNFCGGFGGGCGVPDCREIHMVGPVHMLAKEEAPQWLH